MSTFCSVWANTAPATSAASVTAPKRKEISFLSISMFPNNSEQRARNIHTIGNRTGINPGPDRQVEFDPRFSSPAKRQHLPVVEGADRTEFESRGAGHRRQLVCVVSTKAYYDPARNLSKQRAICPREPEFWYFSVES